MDKLHIWLSTIVRYVLRCITDYNYWPRLFDQKYVKKKKTLLNIYIFPLLRNGNLEIQGIQGMIINEMKRTVNLSTIIYDIYLEKYIKNLLSLGIVYRNIRIRFLIDDNVSRIILSRKIKSCNGGVKNRKWNTLRVQCFARREDLSLHIML